jgi:hypothetical protein
MKEISQMIVKMTEKMRVRHACCTLIEIRINHKEKGDWIMKRKMQVVVLVLAGLLLAGSAQAGSGVIEETWRAPQDFQTKFWQEKFFGGGPGEPGNVLMAVGEGFVFQNAVLAAGDKPVGPCSDNVVTCPEGASFYVRTTYEHGRLTLNSSPKLWLTKGSLQAKDVTAVNTSYHDLNFNLLGFDMTMFGEFDNSPTIHYDIKANFVVTPDNYKPPALDKDGVLMQKGYYFGAEITIDNLDTP